MARRVAAALNAPDSLGDADTGFFWVTGLTVDGEIVVANSYGMAYIPEAVKLPAAVKMATADDAIPAGERARWATYPFGAVQGWAANHDKTLRAVIATKEQFRGVDPGAVKIVLDPEDIPESGAMTGRTRLEVVNRDAFEKLTDTADKDLLELLPPAPVDTAPVDEEPAEAPMDMAAFVAALPPDSELRRLIEMAPPPDAADEPQEDKPTDRRHALWFEVVAPLTSEAAGREVAHLHAFQAYSAYVADAALREAHRAVDPAEQRAAASDWMYWNHLMELLDAALTEPQVAAAGSAV